MMTTSVSDTDRGGGEEETTRYGRKKTKSNHAVERGRREAADSWYGS